MENMLDFVLLVLYTAENLSCTWSCTVLLHGNVECIEAEYVKIEGNVALEDSLHSRKVKKYSKRLIALLAYYSISDFYAKAFPNIQYIKYIIVV